MNEEKLRIIRNPADKYKKLPKDKQMFILGFMQGVLSIYHEQQELEQINRSNGRIVKKDNQ